MHENTKLIIPTPELIREYGKQFDKDPAVPAITKLIEWKPDNTDADGVLLKVVVINKLYSAGIYDVKKVALGISQIADLDTRLSHGEESVVEKVATAGNIRRFYSFATKYCSWHRPDLYPIYDSGVDKLLNSYSEERINPFNMGEPFSIAPGTNLRNYHDFRSVVDAFRKICKLEKVSYQALDKFFYLHSKEVFP